MSATPVPPQPPKSRSALLWVLGILGGALVLLILASLIFTVYIARQIRVREAGSRVEIQTPVGEFKVNKNEAHSTGLPVYPGAVASASEGGNFEFSADDEAIGMAAEKYRSADPVDKVEQWYRNRLGTEYRLETHAKRPNWDRNDRLHMGNVDVAFVDDSGGGARVIGLKRSGDGTEIDLFRVGKREFQ